jgi:hypothetical protein
LPSKRVIYRQKRCRTKGCHSFIQPVGTFSGDITERPLIKTISERNICTQYITPAITDVAGWRISQFFEEFTLGKIHVRRKSVRH